MWKRKNRSGVAETRKRKKRSEITETLISCEGGGNETASGEEEKGGFFACYLLASLSPSHKGRTYIGFTVNPKRRIRQHNGEICSGAWRTKRMRPWEMVLCIYGFPTNVSALQFEWAWQHPKESLAVREAAASFKSFSGLANKIKLAYTMVTLPRWQNLQLTINFLSTKYTKHSAGCPSLPEHMRVQVCSLDELTASDRAVNRGEYDDDDDDELCNKTSSSNESNTDEITDLTLDSPGDQWNSNGEAEATHCQNGGIEGVGTRQQFSDPLMSSEDHTFVVPLSPSFPTGDFSAGAASVEDRYVSGFAKETRVELDEPNSKELPTKGAASNDHPLSYGPAVEVVDLLTPSPAYRISYSRRKRKVSYDCSKIIDLTKSPIFVTL